MSKPVLMSYADWIKDTTVKKRDGRTDKERSTGAGGLQNVDLYLQQYELSTDKWPQWLRQLEIALDAWLASKKTWYGAYDTIRNFATVRSLYQQVKYARSFPDPLPWNQQSYPGIFIAKDPFFYDFEVPADFYGQVDNDLTSLVTKERGKKLLEMISRACAKNKHQVVIQYFDRKMSSSNCAPVSAPLTNEFRRNISEPGGTNVAELLANKCLVALGKKQGTGGPEFIPNTGGNAIVRYDPKDQGIGAERPGKIALAHELVHAYHYVWGICARQITGGTAGDTGQAEEEMRAVGARAYKFDPPSENWIRFEWNLPMRDSYSGNDFKQTTATLFA